MYGVWQTGEDFRLGGQPWAVSASLEKVTDYAIGTIPRIGSTPLCFAQRVGPSDADWTLRGEGLGLLYAGGTKMSEAQGLKHEAERLRNVRAGSPAHPADNRYNVTMNLDVEPGDGLHT